MKHKWAFGWSLILLTVGLQAEVLVLEGLPLQIGWQDLDGDGRQDLVALMIQTETKGEIDAFFEDGQLKAHYEDNTIKEKYLAAFLNRPDRWQAAGRFDLGTQFVFGFALHPGSPLLLWDSDGLLHLRWTEQGWTRDGRWPTPGILGQATASMSGFRFWHQSPEGPYWMVPDVEGLHLIWGLDHRRFLAYPDFGNEIKRGSLRIALPAAVEINGDGFPDLVFQDEKRMEIYMSSQGLLSPERHKLKGQLLDFDGDRLADRVEVEFDDDQIDSHKDLKRLKSHIKVFKATAPLQFEEKPIIDQDFPGMILSDDDLDNEDDGVSFRMTEPFFDVNGDGKMDMAGISLKVSIFQALKMVSMGRMTITFLLSPGLQGDDGVIRPMAGGPFEMVWRLNIRRLSLPAFAQLAADYDGDGWTDILSLEKKDFEITPMTKAGIQRERKWTVRLPKQLRQPAEYYGRDLDGDGKAEIIVLKTARSQTLLGILEAGK